MIGQRIAWAGVGAGLVMGAVALALLALTACRHRLADDSDTRAVSVEATPVPVATVSTGSSSTQTKQAATAVPTVESVDAAPAEEEEVVLTDPLMGAGMDPTLAEVMPDFARVLGKDDILPIYDPVMVSAEESGLEDDDHVMGLAIDGEARAYPVRELFSREMVNDEVAGVPVLVTW